MNIKIEALSLEDEVELFKFEKKNRQFFEKSVPGRGEAFYHFKNFQSKHRDLLKEQENGENLFYLIKDDTGRILGRVNLVEIDPIDKSAEIGFRIGKEYGSKGIASAALKLLFKVHPDFTLKGKTTTCNLGSQKVFEKNGFKVVKIDEASFQLNGQQMKFIHYVSVKVN